MPSTSRRPRQRLLLAAAVAVALAIPAGSSTLAQGETAQGCPSYGTTALVFCSGSDGRAEIFERDEEGTVRQLTYLGGYATSPSISPDGTLVVFEASFAHDPDPQVYVIPRHGPRLRHVVVGPKVITLGDEIVLLGNDVVIRPAARPSRLTGEGSNYDPAFEPGGDRISFTSDRLGVPSLWSMRVDGSDQRELFLARAD